jgi:hypothetical protein
MKKIIFILLLFPSLSYSQFWQSISYGLTFSYDHCRPIEVSDAQSFVYLKQSGNGFHTGLLLTKPINKHLNIESGFIFQNNTYGTEKYYFSSPVYVSGIITDAHFNENTYKFLNIPLGIRYYFNGDRICAFIGGGLSPAILTSHIIKDNYFYNDKLTYRESYYTDDAQKFNLRGQASAGVSVFLTYYTRIDLAAGYNRSVLPVISNETFKEYLQSFGFTFTLSQTL